MGDWRQNLVVMNAEDRELNFLIKKMISYLIDTKIISSEKADNTLGPSDGYCPGENWRHAVEYPEEEHFLTLITNGVAIEKGRSVFYSYSGDFDSLSCPNCGEDNLDCDWSDLFGKWIEDPNSADHECYACKNSYSISQYRFDPLWLLSNLGFTFWNWPILKESFVSELEGVISKKIEIVSGKL